MSHAGHGLKYPVGIVICFIATDPFLFALYLFFIDPVCLVILFVLCLFYTDAVCSFFVFYLF